MNTTNTRAEQQNNYYKLSTTEGFEYYYDIYRHPAPTMAPIIFVGGAFQDISSWKRFVQYFSKITTVVAVDLPGSGVSEHLPINYDFDYLSEALANLLEAENLYHVYLVSTSYGAPVAYQFARNHNDKLDKLIMAGVMQTVPETTRENIFDSLKAVEEHDIDKFIDIVLDGLLSDNSQFDSRKRAFTSKVLAKQLSKISDEQIDKFLSNSRRVLKTGSLPVDHLENTDTLIFTGEYDDFTNISDCRDFTRSIGNASFLTIDQADHLFHLQQFDVLKDIIESHGYGKELNTITGCSNSSIFNKEQQGTGYAQNASPLFFQLLDKIKNMNKRVMSLPMPKAL